MTLNNSRTSELVELMSREEYATTLRLVSSNNIWGIIDSRDNDLSVLRNYILKMENKYNIIIYDGNADAENITIAAILMFALYMLNLQAAYKY